MKWEYKTLKLGAGGIWGGKLNMDEIEQITNDLGSQGWELTAAFGTNQALGQTQDAVLLFKRPMN